MVDIQKLVSNKENSGQTLERIAKVHKLTEMQRSFVREYVYLGADGSPSAKRKAYLKAGFLSEHRAIVEDVTNKSPEAQKARKLMGVNLSVLMHKPKIRLAIEEYKKIYQAERRKDIEIDVHRLIHLRATYSIKDMVGLLLGDTKEEVVEKVKQLPDDVAACVDSVIFKYWGKDNGAFTVEFKFADKDKNLERLGKLAGLWVEKKEVEHKGNTTPQINIQVLNK
jgi:hypothetical protein